jgi:hypothetical protein
MGINAQDYAVAQLGALRLAMEKKKKKYISLNKPIKLLTEADSPKLSPGTATANSRVQDSFGSS